MGTTQIGKSPAIPPPIWKKPIDACFEVVVYQCASAIMYSIPVRTVWTLPIVPLRQCDAKMFPLVESSQPGTKIGRSRSAAARSQESAGSIS